MYDKLSTFPLDSMQPVRLSIDDFGNDAPSTCCEQTPIFVKNSNETYQMLQIGQMFEQKLTREDLEKFKKELRGYDWKAISLPIRGGELDFDTLFYIYAILAYGEGDGNSNRDLFPTEGENPSWKTPCYRYWMHTLAKHIPIWLVKGDEMPEPTISGEYATEYFATYISGEKNHDAYIYLCPERIEAAIEPLNARGIHLTSKELYAFALIHVWAHAIMDPTNKLQGGKFMKTDFQILHKGSHLIQEESLASMIVLLYFDSALDHHIIDTLNVREFMSIQPAAYQYGLLQHDFIRPFWLDWRVYKKNLKIFSEL